MRQPVVAVLAKRAFVGFGAALLIAVALLFGAAAPALAASCTDCHRSGGLAPDGSAHPVPPLATVWDWDRWDGQCTICHEWDSEYAPEYQNPPYGPYSIDDSGDHYWIRDTHCGACHAYVHGSTFTDGAPMFGTWAAPIEGTIDISGSDCAGCHTSGMSTGEWYPASAVPQVDPATHGDPGASHTAALSPQCVDCHGSDLTATHDECSVCHGAGPVSGQSCLTCHPGYVTGHGFPLYGGGYNANAAGYLSWSYVREQTGAVDSPHGNYATSTNKCAVCHAVHRAEKGGAALTAWGGMSGTFSSTMAPFESCFFCHGNGATFTSKTVQFFVTSSGVLSPHTTCGRCHTASPHGAGSSEYAVLAAKLINTHADEQIAFDLAGDGAGSYNGLVESMFDLSDPALYSQGVTLGTGYLCVGCHGNQANQHVFAVNERGATPAVHYSPSGSVGPAGVTGHQVWVEASSTWYNPGVWYSGGGPHDYYLAIYRYKFSDGVWRHFKVASATTFNEVNAAGDLLPGGLTDATTAQIIATYGTWDSTIAWNSALGCAACHDAKRTDGKLAFPHGYANAAGAPAPKWQHRTETGAVMDPDGYLQTSFLWMTVSADADDPRTLVRARGDSTVDANLDGACLKCHLSADRREGIGAGRPEWEEPPPPPPPADTTPPVTTVSGVTEGGSYPAPVTLTFLATDNGGSGVAMTYYTVNGGSAQSGTSLLIDTAGSYTVQYWSVDVAGNSEAYKFVSFTVTAVGTGTIHWDWNATPGSYAYYEVRDASWNLVSSAWGYQWLGWSGHFYITVNINTQYYTRILWYDPYYDEEEYWTPPPGPPAVQRGSTGEWYTSVYLTSPGQIVNLPY